MQAIVLPLLIKNLDISSINNKVLLVSSHSLFLLLVRPVNPTFSSVFLIFRLAEEYDIRWPLAFTFARSIVNILLFARPDPRAPRAISRSENSTDRMLSTFGEFLHPAFARTRRDARLCLSKRRDTRSGLW